MADKLEVSLFVSDKSVGFFHYNPAVINQSKYGVYHLEEGVVRNGYILDPNNFKSALRTLFLEGKVQPTKIRMVIQDQNTIVREVVVPKVDISKKSIDTYLKEQKGNAVHYPFESPNVTHIVRKKSETSTNVLAIAADDNLFQDYYDIFESLGIKQAEFDIASSAIYQLYLSKIDYQPLQAMLVSLYDNMVSIQIMERAVPVFSMTEEFQGGNEQFYDFIENYVERIANYYKFNIKKGAATVWNVLLVNFTSTLTPRDVKNSIIPRLAHLNAEVFEFFDANSPLRAMPKAAQMAYASAVSQSTNAKFKLNFEVVRKSALAYYSSQLMVGAFAVLSAVSVVYIPFVSANLAINAQLNQNFNLQNQLQVLQLQQTQQVNVPAVERDYSNAFDLISTNSYSPSDMIADLMSKVDGTLKVNNIQVQTLNNRIVLVISSIETEELYEYLLAIYEEFGITTTAGVSDGRWINGAPTRRFLSNNQLEVTVQYA